MFSQEGQGDTESWGCWPLPPTIPEPQLLQAGLWSLGWAGLSPLSCPLCPFSCITPISASNCSQGLLKSPRQQPSLGRKWGSCEAGELSWGIKGVGGHSGNRGPEKPHTEGTWKGPHSWLPAQLPRLLCVALWAFASSFRRLVLTVGPAPCLWWKGQPFIVG